MTEKNTQTPTQAASSQSDSTQSNTWFIASLLAVVFIAAGVLWYVNQTVQPALIENSLLPAPITGHVVAPLAIEPPVENVAIPALVNQVTQFDGKKVEIQGRLSHRKRTGYGWNLNFDLFDAAGNWVSLKGIPEGTPVEVQYRAVGIVRKGAYGPEMNVSTLTRISG